MTAERFLVEPGDVIGEATFRMQYRDGVLHPDSARLAIEAMLRHLHDRMAPDEWTALSAAIVQTLQNSEGD